MDYRDNRQRWAESHQVVHFYAGQWCTFTPALTGKTISELASEAGVDRSYFSRVLRLRFLAPAAVKTILRGNHPLEITAKRLTLRLKLPIRWNDQISELGIQ